MAITYLDKYYAETNQDADGDLRKSSVATRRAQTFTPSVSGKLSQVKFYLKKVSTPTGNIFAKLYATSSSKPSGTALTTSANVDVSTLSTDYGLITFTFSTPYLISKANMYAISVEGSWTMDGSSYVKVGLDSNGDFLGGKHWYYGASWSSIAPAEEVIFYCYMNIINRHKVLFM